MFGQRYTVTHTERRDGTACTFIHDTRLNSGSAMSGYYSEADALALLKSVRERITAK